MFLDHQMFLKSWLPYRCRLTNQYSIVCSLLKAHKQTNKQRYALTVITRMKYNIIAFWEQSDLLAKCILHVLTSFSKILLHKQGNCKIKFQMNKQHTYSSTGSGRPYWTAANHVFQSHATHPPV